MACSGFCVRCARYPYYDTGATQFLSPLMIAVSPKRTTYSNRYAQRYFYDGLGRLVQQHTSVNVIPSGYSTAQDILQSTGYNALGQVISQTVPYAAPAYVSNGTSPYTTANLSTAAKSLTTYDGAGRVKQVTGTDGTTTNHYYGVDNNGGNYNYQFTNTNMWQHSVADPNGHQVHTITDGFGRVYRIREFSGDSTATYTKYSETTYQYNQMDLLTSVTDGLNNVTTISYDHIGQKIGMVDPDMGAWSYAYDGAGNLTRQTDAKNQTICLYYDNIARLTGKHYRPDTSCPTSNPSLNVSFGYDSGTNGIGRRTSMTDASGSTTWSYDLRGRLTQENVTISGSGATAGTFVTQWGYDTLDRPSWIKYPGGNASQVGEQVTYTYHDNVASWLVSVVGTSTYAKNIAYDVAGRIDLLSLGLSGSNPVLNVDYVYNAWTTQGGRLQQTKTGTPSNATSLQDLQYTYDNAGNVLTIKDYRAGSPQTQTFGYDFLNRLTSAQASGGTGGTYGVESYVFNQIGNLTNKGAAGISYPASSPASGCASGTPTTKPHAASGSTSNPGTNTYAYDCNGNITTRTIGGTSYTLAYDQENRLTGVSGGTTATFVYNGDGERVKGTAGGVTTAYVGNHYEVAGSTVKKYYYAGSLRIAMNDSGTLKFLVGDHLGSTSIVANGTTGALISEVRYKPWGETRYTSGTTPTTIRYTGQRQESSLGGTDGLYFYNARWYDPAIGRFTSPDAIVPGPLNPQALNRYGYGLSNPLKYIDPSGHWPDLPNWVYWAGGAAAQYVDDVTYGAALPALSVDLNQVNNPAFQEGRSVGRTAAAVQGATELVLGSAAAIGSAMAIPPTTGGGAACVVASGGVCAVPLVPAIAVEVVGVVGGAAVAAQGARVLAATSRGMGSSGPSLTDLSRSSGAMDRNGLTSAGRALQKHGNRAGSVWPQINGHSELNRVGQELVDAILTDPNSIIKQVTRKNYGSLIEVIAPDGRGLRFDAATWELIGFLEP